MHNEYPHEPGRLWGCGPCETGPCVCVPTADGFREEACVSDFCIQACNECGSAPCECEAVPDGCPAPAFHASPAHVCPASA